MILILKPGAFTVSREHLETKQKPLATNVNLSVNGVKDICKLRTSSCLQKHDAAYMHKLIYMQVASRYAATDDYTGLWLKGAAMM